MDTAELIFEFFFVLVPANKRLANKAFIDFCHLKFD